MPTNPIAIIGAMDSELVTLLNQLEEKQEETYCGLTFYAGTLCERAVVLVKCGVGKVNAARCAQMLIDRYAPAALINTGIAGGVGPGLQVGDIVVSTGLVQHDYDVTPFGYVKGNMCERDHADTPTIFGADEAVASAVVEAAETVLGHEKVHRGLIATGDQFIAGAEKKAEIYGSFKALAAEMEGGAIAQVAALSSVPFVVIRAISDLADGTAAASYDAFEQAAADASATTVIGTVKRLGSYKIL